MLDLGIELVLQTGQIVVALVLVHLGDHVGGEVDDALQILRGDVQQVAQARGHTLEEPNVSHRSGELDVAHALTAHAATGHFNAASLADDALEAHALVLTAGALPIAGRTEDLLTEQTVLLRLQSTVVDGFRLLDLAVAPAADIVGGGQADTKLVKCVDVQHLLIRFC